MYKKLFAILILMIVSGCATEKAPTLGKRVQIKKHSQINEQFENWNFTKDGTKCYIASFPLSSSGDYLTRDAHYIMINYNSNAKENEVAIIGGKAYQNNGYTRVQVQDTSFFFLNYDTYAWAINDHDVLNKILDEQTEIIIFSDFNDGKKAIDKYSTKGFKDAFTALGSNCSK